MSDSGKRAFDTKEEALRAALKNLMVVREELRCAEIQDRQSMIVACVFGSVFLLCGLLGLTVGLSLILMHWTILGVALCIFSITSFGIVYLVKASYNYGRRSYKIALNLKKDAIEEYMAVADFGEVSAYYTEVSR